MAEVLRVGLTGGIAVGKSAVARMFASRGVHVIQADQIAHQLLSPGEQVYTQVVQQFGREILNPDGTIDRRRLAEKAFSGDDCVAPHRARVDELNRIIHPAVIKRQEQWMDEVAAQHPSGVAIVEAALIIEAGVAGRFDKLIVVVCSPEQKVERFAKRMRLDIETARRDVMRRSAAQLTDEEKAKAADYVIDNSGTLKETERQVESIFRELKVHSAQKVQLKS